MAPRTRRGAPTPPTQQQFIRLARTCERLAKMVERSAVTTATNASELEALRDELTVQLKRIGQLQAELDTSKKAWGKMQSP